MSEVVILPGIGVEHRSRADWLEWCRFSSNAMTEVEEVLARLDGYVGPWPPRQTVFALPWIPEASPGWWKRAGMPFKANTKGWRV